MLTRSRNTITWLEFNHLQAFPQIRHACFTNSLPILPPLNSQAIAQHLTQSIYLQDTPNNLISMRQEHGVTMQFVEDGYDPSHPCDAIATNQADKTLLVQHADCQPCILFDPSLQVIAAVHSGWKGSIKNIYHQTIMGLQQRYGCDPRNIIACIGPSLGPEHAQFVHYKQEIPAAFWSYKTKDHFFNFWTISENQLLSCGLKKENIEIARICTYEQQNNFFSYRRDKTNLRNITCISRIQTA